jgi:gamma-F420-2:alpha-L-glutamate ligase
VTRMKKGWLLYDERDYNVNRMFAVHIMRAGEGHGLSLEVVLTEDFDIALRTPPQFVISRQRNPLLSKTLEAMGIPVFNCARVCELCNDKRETHRFLEGFPLLRSAFLESEETPIPPDFPAVIKPAFGHGGDRVALVNDPVETKAALSWIFPAPAITQEPASEAGKDLRIYVLFGEIVAAVLRTARSGIVSNYKKGGDVSLHSPNTAETELARSVIKRFSDADAPLSFAGIDLLYHHGQPVVNEVEDVVGSRMLYKVSDLDIIGMYAERLARALK